MYMHLLREDPNHVASLNNLAGLLIKQGHFEQAAQHLSRVLALAPDHLPALCNQAILHHAAGRLDDAITLLKQVCQTHPSASQPRYQLALMIMQSGQLEEADSMLQQLIALNPKHAKAWTRRGEIQQQFNNPGQALMAYDEAIRFSPEDAKPALKLKRALALPIILHDLEHIDLCRQTLMQTLDRLEVELVQIADPLEAIATTTSYLAYHGRDDRPIQQSLASFYRKACPSLTWEAPHVSQPYAPQRPIRLAMVSRYLNNHTIGMFMLGIAQQLDPAKFELSVFHVSNQHDAIAEAINAKAVFSAVLPPHLHAARKLIASQQPDVLLYPDIGMEPMAYFLAFARLAKVQCAWWGNRVTTGIDTMDYYLSNEALESANAQDRYTEKLVCLPTLAMYPQRPQPAQERTPLSHWGIESNAHLYLCCQNLFKVHPDFDDLLKQILEKDADALIVFFQGRHPHWHQMLRNRWNKTIGQMGRRIVFLPRQPFPLFLQLVEQAHVILDTLHFTGGNTTFQCLGLGKPIVTLPGTYMKSRITAAVYEQMGMTELIAANTDDYIRLTVKLGTDEAFNQQMSRKILAENQVLFTHSPAVHELEVFLLNACNAPR
jgi:predicted O-linked N-acetylglucosamine transferase (SPINDLY family)